MNNLKSYTEYAVTSETTDFVIGFDFNYGTDAVNVTVDGVPATEAGYTVVYLNSTTMRLTPAVPTGVVRLERETDIDVPDNSFTAGAKFIASNMDENFTQIRHAQQEVRDGFNKLSVDTNEIIDTLQVVGEAAQDAADAAEAAAVLANDAAAQVSDKVPKSVTVPTYTTPTAGVDPVTGVQNGAYYNVRSTEDDSFLVEYQNIGGVPTPSGKSYPTSSAFNGLPSIAEMLAIRNPKNASRVFVVGYHAGSLVGGDDFLYSASSTLTADNGIVFDCPDGGKWIRLHKGFVSFDAYGAIGDDTSDSTARISACVANTYCRRVEQDSGTFLVSSPLAKMVKNTDVKMGNDALVKVKDGSIGTTFPSVSSHIFTVSDDCSLKVNVDGVTKTGLRAIGSDYGVITKNVKVHNSFIRNVFFGIRADGAQKWHVKDNVFYNFRQSGILFTVKRGASVLRNIITENYFEQMGDTAFAISSDAGTTEDDEIAYNIVSTNIAKDTQEYIDGVAFDLETGYNEYKHHNIFANNTVEQTYTNGMRRGGLTMIKSAHSVITGNTVKGAGFGATNTNGRGVTAYSSTGMVVADNIVTDMPVGIDVSSSKDTLVCNNILTDCGENSSVYPSIRISNSLGPFENVVIKGNIIRHTSSYDRNAAAISARQDQSMLTTALGKKLRILDNVVVGVKGFAIYITGAVDNISEDVQVKGNNLDCSLSTSAPVYFRYVKELDLVGNSIKDVEVAMSFDDCDEVTIIENSIKNKITSAAKYFALGGATRPSTNISVNRNRFKSVLATPISSSDLSKPTLILTGNIGDKIESSRKGIVNAISSGYTVLHGLPLIPTFIDLTTSTAGLTGFYVSDITSTSFNINFAGSSAASFMWKAEV